MSTPEKDASADAAASETATNTSTTPESKSTSEGASASASMNAPETQDALARDAATSGAAGVASEEANAPGSADTGAPAPKAAAPTKVKKKKPPLRERAKQRWSRGREIYFTFDRRSLGLGRIGLALLLLHDLIRRVPGISTWYSNDGLIPNHAALWRPHADYVFSLMLAASTVSEVAVMFALSAIVFLVFLVGWRTRLFHALSFVCLVSLHSRVILLENGGDVVLISLCAWSLFMPMGDRFSIDAVLAAMRAKREGAVNELEERSAWRAPTERPFVSLAVLALLLQVSVIYYFNAVHKHGWTWRGGSAVHYVLYQERMVTWFGVWLRQYINMWTSRAMSYATLATEIAGPFLILNPYFKMRTRSIAILLMPGLHIVFAACLNLGQFSFNMMGFFPFLLSPEDWKAIHRFLGPAEHRARTVHFDPSNAVASTFARLIARLDAFDRLQFVAIAPSSTSENADHADSASPTANVAAASVQNAPSTPHPTTWFVEHPATHEKTTGARALAACWAALPLGLPFSWILDISIFRSIADAIGDFITRRQTTVEATFDLAPLQPKDGRIARFEGAEEAPITRWFGRRKIELREATLVLLLIAVGSQVLEENRAVPKQLKFGQHKFLQQIVTYPRMFQGWGMFSSDVPVAERMVYVDAVTFGGRHVDPFNEAASRVANLPVERIPPHMIQDEFWCDYTNRIPETQTYWRVLKEWILNYHHRTMRREDRVISFEVRTLDSDSPPPGEHEARNFRTKVIMTDKD